MIIECPECGAKNSTDKPPQPGKKYRCGKCGATITFLQTTDTQDTLAEIPREKTQAEREEAKKGKISMKRIGMGVGCGFIAIILIALIAVLIGGLTGGGDKTEGSPLTSSEQAYAITIADHVGRFSEASYNLSHLFLNPQIGNDDWALDIAVQLAKQRALYDEAREIDSPSSMANIHYKYMQAMNHSEAANHLIARWLDEPDNLNLLEQATTEMLTCGQLLEEATSLLEIFLEEQSK